MPTASSGGKRNTGGSSSPRRTHSAGLRRDLDLLLALGSDEAVRAGGLGVTRAAQLAGRDKSQASRTLATLAEVGLVERVEETGNYRLGWQLYALAAHTAERRLVVVAERHLRGLVGGIGETVHLCVLRAGNVITLASELAAHAFRGPEWEGTSVSAHGTSAGRVLLSDWAADSVRAWWDEHPPPPSVTRAVPAALSSGPAASSEQVLHTSRLQTYPELVAELRRIRRRGFATVDEEFEPGLVGVSAAVHDFRGRIVAALNVSAPKHRLGPLLERAGAVTARTAAALSADLGWVPPGHPGSGSASETDTSRS